MSLFDLRPKESPAELYGREEELDEVVGLVKAGRWVAVLGPRFVGKTSLVKAMNPVLEEAGFQAVYVNLWGARRVQGLLEGVARGLSSSRGLMDRVKEALGRIEGVSVGPGGVSVSAPRRPMRTAWDVFDALGREGGRYVVELDEVQELSAVSGYLLKLLANVFNTYRNIVFVFTGSMFGLMKALLEPGPSSPLYGRSPARVFLEPFTREDSAGFLRKGFEEHRLRWIDDSISEAVKRLNGVPGWLTLYGNNVAVRGLDHVEALDETEREGLKIVRDEVEHFLEGRDREGHVAALKAAAVGARWSEVKGAMETVLGSPVNSATVGNVLRSLMAAMLIRKGDGVYRVHDPMLRTLLLTSTLT